MFRLLIWTAGSSTTSSFTKNLKIMIGRRWKCFSNIRRLYFAKGLDPAFQRIIQKLVKHLRGRLLQISSWKLLPILEKTIFQKFDWVLDMLLPLARLYESLVCQRIVTHLRSFFPSNWWFCAIWYHLYNFEKVKSTYGRVLF